jgi:Arc/MetJ-type ribon-helix-helix transcriptional regulator
MEKKSVSLSPKLYNTILNRVENSSEFSTVDDYVSYVLTEIFKNESEQNYSKEEEAEIEKNLKDLGYI